MLHLPLIYRTLLVVVVETSRIMPIFQLTVMGLKFQLRLISQPKIQSKGFGMVLE